MNRFSTGLWFIAGLLLASSAYSQTAVLTHTLAGDPEVSFLGNFYGDHQAVNGDWLFVGAPREDVDLDFSGTIDAGETDVGAVYIYRMTAGVPMLAQKLTGIGRFDGSIVADRFGSGVTSTGDWLFVNSANAGDFGAAVDPNPDPFGDGSPDFFFAGKVLVYRLDKKTELWEGPVQTLTSDEPQSTGGFSSRTDASHVALFGFGSENPKVALIGEAGCCRVVQKLHVFKRTGKTWRRVQIFGSPSGSTVSFFADGVINAGDFALVSELVTAMPAVAEPYVVHVYKVTGSGIHGSGPVQTLLPQTASDPAICGTRGFGNGGMAASGNVAVIVDPCDSSAGFPQAGAINVYEVKRGRKPVRFREQLFDPNPEADFFLGLQGFGRGVQTAATDGDLIVVGTTAIFSGNPRKESGEVLLFGRSGGPGKNFGSFAFLDTLTDPAPLTAFPSFGQSVLISGDQLSVGEVNIANPVNGRVLIFDLQ